VVGTGQYLAAEANRRVSASRVSSQKRKEKVEREVRISLWGHAISQEEKERNEHARWREARTSEEKNKREEVSSGCQLPRHALFLRRPSLGIFMRSPFG
jgi:hypothetical protein